MNGRKPGTKGHKIAIKYIISQFKKRRLLTVTNCNNKECTNKSYEHSFDNNFAQFTNIMGMIPGTGHLSTVDTDTVDTDTIGTIVITAHYDHLGTDTNTNEIFYGADDNASGVVTLFMMMKWFSQKNHKPRHNLLFICFDGEESYEYPDGTNTGLLGSSHFVEQYLAGKFNSDKQQINIVLNFNIDMICNNDQTHQGKPRIKGLMVNGINGKIKYWKQIIGPIYDKLTYNKQKETEWYESQDAYSFAKHNIPWLYFGVDDFDNYHTIKDRFDSIDPNVFWNNIKILVNVMISIDKQF